MNLYVASSVPLSHLKFVAIAYGAATPLVLDDAHYREKFGGSNPNLALIERLRKAGVDVAYAGKRSQSIISSIHGSTNPSPRRCRA